VFEKRKRRKAASRRFDEAIASEWARHGVKLRDSTGPAFRQAVREAGLGSPGDPEYSELAIAVVRTAKEALSEEDKFIVTGGREGRDPCAYDKATAERPTAGDTATMVGELIDADLAAAKENRLPTSDRAALARLLLGGDNAEAVYLDAFESGYSWARTSELFLVSVGGPVDDVLDNVASSYAAAEGLVEGGPESRAEALTQAVFAAQKGQLITNEALNPYGSTDEAFARMCERLLADPATNPRFASNAFHGGAAFYAAETQVILRLIMRRRIERVSARTE
jgi:hypothetical protein